VTDEEIRLTSTSVAQEDPPPPVADQCNDETWHEWLHFVDTITGHPVKYGPGRGLFVDGKFVVTHGPGALNSKAWNGGQTFPSFHCTSLCNFALGWLTRRNEDYTHAGNIPELWDLLEAPPAARFQSGVGRWGGYGDVCYEIESNGSTAARVHRLINGKAHIDAMEMYERRAEMPTFVVFAQSTFFPAGLNTWHHTGFFVFRDGRMFRIAADGYASNGYWSGDPIRYVEITPDNIATLDLCRYRVWGVRTNADGSYGDPSRPIAEVAFE
jgi:hypothetical protein